MSSSWYGHQMLNERFKEKYGKDIDSEPFFEFEDEHLVVALKGILAAVSIYSFGSIFAGLLPLLWVLMKSHPQITANIVEICVKGLVGGEEPEVIVKKAGVVSGREALIDWLTKLQDNLQK